MTNELKVLKIVVTKLAKINIPYMVTGSIAANFYTIPRMTRDIDIVIDIMENDINKFIDLFSDE